MTDNRQPRTARPYRSDDTRPVTTWTQALQRLQESSTYWLATVRPDGRPHVMPVLGVWREGTFYFCAGATTRKARNLAQNPQCVITASTGDLDLVVEGAAAHISDGVKLERVAEDYRSKYGWEPAPRGGAFYGEGAPTAGPPPLDLYAVAPRLAFSFGTSESLNAMRWSFEP